MSHSGKPKESLPDPIVHQGHPLDPNRGRVLSQDDEKRMDDQGRPVVHGQLWSRSKTGAYLCVVVSKEPVRCDRTFLGGSNTFGVSLGVHGGLHVAIGATMGKPKFHHEYWGAALEVPSDLGTDPLKRDYVTQWVAHTAAEALGATGFNTSDEKAVEQAGIHVASMANEALNKLGL